MPLKKTINAKGEECWKWGDSGKLYCGKGAKEKATKQAIAIISSEANDFKRKQEESKL